MTDETQAADGAAEAQTAVPNIQIRAQFLRDCSFEAPQGPLPLIGAKDQPTIAVNVNVKHRPIQQLGYEVVLSLRAESKIAEQALYIVEIDYAALVSLGDGLSPEIVNAILLVEVPRLLFPFARRLVSDLVIEGGMPPLNINPIDFVAVARNAQQQQQNAAAPSGTTIQ